MRFFPVSCLFALISSFTHSLTPLGYLETTRLEKLLRLLAARRQTDEYEISLGDFRIFSSNFSDFDFPALMKDASELQKRLPVLFT